MTNPHLIGSPQLIDRALKLVLPDSLEAGRLLCRNGPTLYFQEGDYEKAQSTFAQALDIAGREQDIALEMQTLVGAAFVDIFQLRWRDSLEKSLKAIDLARRIDDPHGEAAARYSAVVTLAYTGDPDGAVTHAAAGLAAAGRLRDRNWLCRALVGNTLPLLFKGEWRSARRLNEGAVAASSHDPRPLLLGVVLEHEEGEFDLGKRYLERLLELMRVTPPGPNCEYEVALTIPIAARISGSVASLNVAETAAKTSLSSPSVTPLIATFARIGLGLIAVHRDDVALATEQYLALESRRGTFFFVSVDRLLGLLSCVMGHLDQAVEHFEGALAFCHRAGYRPELAWTCCDYADALLQRNSVADRIKAKALLEEALTISHELGMRPLTERVMARLAQMDTQSEVTVGHPDGLTHREVEVLRLIAAGKTNREIADALVISLRTVANHVASILNKTSSANRAEAATYAARHGLV